MKCGKIIIEAVFKEGIIIDKVEVKVNVINQLRLLRQSTFKDIFCFLDENIQNAQRAKATEVKISIEREQRKVIIENNGQILENPQALFSIADSGWDEKTKQTENPFGMGFFSNITVSNLIEVHSGNTLITFDVDNMITTNNTEIKVEVVSEYYDGFKLILNRFDFGAASQWDIRDRVCILGKYVHELDIYYNDVLQDKKDLTTGDNSKFLFSITEELDFTGWIALAGNYNYSSKLNIFYKGRLVSELDQLPYLKGDIHVSDGALNLTSPDRKNIINDEKLSEFKQLIRIYVEDYCNSLLIDSEDIEGFTPCINYYINKAKIKNSIRFMTFKSNSESDFKYLQGIALVRRKNEDISNFSKYELYLNKKATMSSEEHVQEVEITPLLQTKPEEAVGRVVHEGYSSYSEGYLEVPRINEEKLIEKRGSTIIDVAEPIFYLEFNEVEKYETKLNMARHYSLRIIVARNTVEAELLQNMKDTDGVSHISELKEEVQVVGILSNTELKGKERRAMMIFDMLSRLFNFNYNIFALGDLMVIKNISIEAIDVVQEIIEPEAVVLKDSQLNKIYVDRSIVDKTQLRDELVDTLDIKDYQFILANFKNLVGQISLLLDKTQTDCENILLASLAG